MGLLLLCWSAGSVSAMPLSGRLTTRFGDRNVLACFSAVAVIGLLGAGLAASGGAVLMTGGLLAAVGVGAALVFPLGMSAAGDDPARAAARTAVVATIGYGAFLTGPPLLGLLADHVGFRLAMLALAAPAAPAIALAPAARRRVPTRPPQR
jgi:MFS family permease